MSVLCLGRIRDLLGMAAAAAVAAVATVAAVAAYSHHVVW